MTLANFYNAQAIIGYSKSPSASQNLPRIETFQRFMIIRSKSAQDWVQSALASLHEIAGRCSVAGWDGEEARPIPIKAVAIAENVVWALYAILPQGAPSPDIIPESDGEICFSWDLADGRIFSMSIGEHGKINYAGQLGKKGGAHGWLPIDVSNPWALRADLQEIAKYINKLFI